MNKKEQLTEHFTLKELTASKSHPEVRNVPDEKQIENLKEVCRWLEKLRVDYNDNYPTKDGKEQPIIINSGFRCPMLNKVVGGSSTSNHLTGCAVDIRCNTAKQALRYAVCLIDLFEAAGKLWDEIYVERQGVVPWVHFAVRPSKNRGRVSVYCA